MQVLKAGHTYEVSNFENKDQKGQIIQFIHKEPVTDGVVVLKTISDGTTTEELIEVLIDRMQFLNDRFPCFENTQAIVNLTQSLMWLEKRTSDRMKRNVEGKNIK